VSARALVLALIGTACGPRLVWYAHSPDRRHDVRIVEHRGQFIVVDGRRGPTFDAVPIGTLAMSRRGGHLAYAARAARRWRVVIDGVLGPAYDGIGELLYSADGEHLAYAAQRGRSWRVVVDGREGPPFDALLAHALQFSADSRRLAYAGLRADGAHVVVDGTIGSGWNGIGQLAFSADSQHVAYVARAGDVAVAVFDGESGRGYDSIRELVLSASGGRFGFVAERGGSWLAVIDRIESERWDLVRGLAFSDDGAHVAYAARRTQGDTSVVVDGVAGSSYAGVRPATIAFASRAARPTYVARRGSRFVVVHDGAEGPPFDEVHPPVFSADGTRWGYVARFDSAWIPVIDGTLASSERWASDPVWSDDGHRLAYLARRGADTAVVVDGTEQRFDIVLDGTLVFDASGRHWGCVIGDRRERQFYFVVDGARRSRLEIDEAIDASMRTRALGEFATDNDRVLHDWVTAEVGKAVR
jgi:hypothetical protein